MKPNEKCPNTILWMLVELRKRPWPNLRIPNASLEARKALEEANQREANLAKELSDLKATQTAAGTQVTLRDMMFESGKAELTPGGILDVEKLARIAKQNPNKNVVIEGHTDSVGSEAYNIQLSERRAQTVKKYLEANGYPPDKVTIKGYGESFPVASNKTRDGRQLNRRVVVTILDEGKTATDVQQK